MQRLAHGQGPPTTPRGLLLFRVGILALPVSLLSIAALRLTGEQQMLLGVGAFFQGLAFVVAISARGTMAQPITPAVVMLYVIGLSWILLGGLQVNGPQFN